METVEGKRIDYHALVHVLADAYFPMVMRVPSRFFTSAHKPNFYIAAGSFTGFLIRTFGWETYVKFFRKANENDYEAVFERDFGLGILAAERRWRLELLQGRKAQEPGLSQAVAEHRVEAAYNTWQFYRCLEEVERLGRAGHLSSEVLWFALGAHAILGHYSDAAALNKQLLERNDEWVEKHRSRLWLSLGNLYDLLGQRAEALQAYEKVLAEPDSWLADEAFAHALARGYTQEAYTERHLMQRYRYWVR
jgi:tetratricopeptide (TPR) repeat protein